ncbi:hypothetical protein [Nitrososphaera sp.]|uniref:glycoside hydrolase family 113 n=1 Tax=Nitrososphaera sp. TaxID=1971748 RepID=UPI00184F4C9F|nr:hypothetical protein [Nitrososphaera sp.]NWG37996.1 hypothetical protein [Nitrososphaera sp.]
MGKKLAVAIVAIVAIAGLVAVSKILGDMRAAQLEDENAQPAVEENAAGNDAAVSETAAIGDTVVSETKECPRPPPAAPFPPVAQVTKVADGDRVSLDVKGIEFPDVFGRLGGDDFDIDPDNPACFPAVMEHVLDGPSRVNANLVAIAPAVFYEQIRPTPKFAPWNNDLSLTDTGYYAKLVGAFKAEGFQVMHTEQVSPGFYGTPEDWAMLDTMKQDPAWWDAWFDEWEKWVVPRAALAEANDVDVFVLVSWTDSTFRPDIYPDYDTRWRDIIAKVREVYSGDVGVILSNTAQESFTFADAVDVVVIGSFSGYQLNIQADGKKVISNRNNPTLAELTEAYEITFDQSEGRFPASLPVYYAIGAVSADGQAGSEDVEVIPTIDPDFEEQALYYEALFAALEDETWVDGLIIQRMDWFDQYERSAEVYWDETRSSSPRSKPAESIMTFWYSVT